MRKCMQGSIQKLLQTLYSVGRQAAAPVKAGRRRNSKLIPLVSMLLTILLHLLPNKTIKLNIFQVLRPIEMLLRTLVTCHWHSLFSVRKDPSVGSDSVCLSDHAQLLNYH